MRARDCMSQIYIYQTERELLLRDQIRVAWRVYLLHHDHRTSGNRDDERGQGISFSSFWSEPPIPHQACRTIRFSKDPEYYQRAMYYSNINIFLPLYQNRTKEELASIIEQSSSNPGLIYKYEKDFLLTLILIKFGEKYPNLIFK